MIKNAAKAFATIATAAALIGGSALAANAVTAPRPTPEPTITLEPRPFPRPTIYPTVRPVRHPVLYDIDYDSRRGCDRLSFLFRGDTPDDVTVRWVRQLRESPSGRLVRLPGRAFLLVRFEDARSLRSLRGTQQVGLDDVRAYRLLGDHDGVVTIGLGLRQRAPYFVRTLDDRIVLTVCGDDDRPRPRPYPRHIEH